MPTKCEIKWIDENGNPTPDENPAIYRVRCKARVEQHHGRAILFSESRWFNCCAEHFKRLSEPGMKIWECETLLPHYPINDLHALERPLSDSEIKHQGELRASKDAEPRS